MATWENDPRAVVKIINKGDTVVLDHVVRGNQPKGAAAKMVAEAIQASENPKPTKISIPNITQKAPNSDALLRDVAVSAAEELGGSATNVRSGVDATGKHFVEMDVVY